MFLGSWKWVYQWYDVLIFKCWIVYWILSSCHSWDPIVSVNWFAACYWPPKTRNLLQPLVWRNFFSSRWLWRRARTRIFWRDTPWLTPPLSKEFMAELYIQAPVSYLDFLQTARKDRAAVIDPSSSMPYVTSHPDGINGGWKGCKPLLDQCL